MEECYKKHKDVTKSSMKEANKSISQKIWTINQIEDSVFQNFIKYCTQKFPETYYVVYYA